MNAALNDEHFRPGPGSFPQLPPDDLHTARLDLIRLYKFNVIKHLRSASLFFNAYPRRQLLIDGMLFLDHAGYIVCRLQKRARRNTEVLRHD